MDEAIYALNAECDAMQDEIARLESENAKLRELCKDLWRDIPKSNCEWDMDANLCTGYDKCHGECGLWMRLRELGVEVD